MTSAQKSLTDTVPEAPGVYLFRGAAETLLYVGKSKSLRSRVRSHFSSPDERHMCRQVRHIEIRRTAGELGALLLESQLIKTLRPMYNVMSREKHRIIVGRRVYTNDGYASVLLEAVDGIDPKQTNPIMAIFKNWAQAREYLCGIVKTHSLCSKLLRLETTKRHCFSYYLRQCKGACAGEEDPALYNARFDSAFEERRIKAWPYEGGVVIEERSPTGDESELFFVDYWCLLSSYARAGEAYRRGISGSNSFDYDSYKILAHYMYSEPHAVNIYAVPRGQFEGLLSSDPSAFPSGFCSR